MRCVSVCVCMCVLQLMDLVRRGWDRGEGRIKGRIERRGWERTRQSRCARMVVWGQRVRTMSPSRLKASAVTAATHSVSSSSSQLKVMSRQTNLADIVHLMFAQQQMDHTWWLLFVIWMDGRVKIGKRCRRRKVDRFRWVMRNEAVHIIRHGLFNQIMKITVFRISMTWTTWICAVASCLLMNNVTIGS